MLDFVFFNTAARQQFIDFVKDNDLTYALEEEDEKTFSVLLADDLDDELWDRVDDYYDVLMAAQAKAVNAEDEDSVDLVGVQYTRQDGDVAVVRMQPDLVNQLTACMSLEELQVMVQIIADEVQEHRKGSMCKVLSSA